MPKLLPIGTLVRVLPSATKSGAPFSGANRDTTGEHGWLYFITSNSGVTINGADGYGPYGTRSLATGQEGITWLPEEIEAAPTEEQSI
jgi:hypothetical protein